MEFSSLTEQLMGLGTGRWALHHRAVQRSREGADIVFLSIGEPRISTPKTIVDTAVASLRAGRTKYALGRGEPELLSVLANRYRKRTGRDIGPDQVTFFPGSHTALYALCQALLEAGDHIMVPEPFYAAYEGIIRASRAEIDYVPLRPDTHFHLQVEDLEAALRPESKVLLLNNPHNPTGSVLAPTVIREVADFCARHDLWLISDEAYEHHIYDGEFLSVFDIPEHADRTAVIASVSKSHAMTGWRCGWAVGSPQLIERVVAVSEAMMFGAQPFLQDATAYALTHEFEELDGMIADYGRRARLVAGLLSGSEKVSCHLPESGIFVMVDLRATGLSGEEFATRLLEEKNVATMPGESFGPSAAGHIRLSLTATDDAIETGCSRIVELAESIAG
ncbi:MAG: aminotransferase class I/II-fold pyridoxal phosphate-dependent enzyme [Acidimicrobiia bacterium]|nr:aminotransferase class I/II-fold pyridoxal phosphate-dependent enzyme [Acidimicrobiia bacterium]